MFGRWYYTGAGLTLRRKAGDSLPILYKEIVEAGKEPTCHVPDLVAGGSVEEDDSKDVDHLQEGLCIDHSVIGVD